MNYKRLSTRNRVKDDYDEDLYWVDRIDSVDDLCNVLGTDETELAYNKIARILNFMEDNGVIKTWNLSALRGLFNDVWGNGWK